jgi:hypothetical protein
VAHTLNRRVQTLERSRPRIGGKAIAPGEAMRELLTQRRSVRLGTSIGFMDWALRVPEPKAGRLDFDRFPFQVELYSAGVNDEEAVIKKSTQVGISAYGVRWALYHADTAGRTGLYIFPTARDMWDFSTLRIGPVIRNSPYLAARQRPDDPDNKGMKGIGLGTVVFRGSESVRGLESVDADHMVFDEYDLLEHDNIPVAERRTGASLFGYKRRIGWPSVPGWGIDALYEESDQRQWMVRCAACREWQAMDFFKNVDVRNGMRVCAKCRKPIDVAKGEWVARFPDQDRPRGYHVTQLLVPGKSMRDLIRASKKRRPSEKQSFMNRDLGEAWAPEEGRLSDAAFEAAVAAGGGYNAATSLPEVVSSAGALRTMGVDVATTRNINVRVSEHLEGAGDRKRALFVGEVESFSEVDELFQRFAVNMAAVDHLPEGRLARAFAERHPGQVYLIALTDSAGRVKEPLSVDDSMMSASVNRTVAIDAMLEQIRGQQNLLPANAPEGYKEALQAPNRIVLRDEDTGGGIGAAGKRTVNPPKGARVFYRSSGPDDYAMAEVFDVMATELWWRRKLVDEAERPTFSTIDDELDFERSALSEYAPVEDYYAGGEGMDGDEISAYR